MLTLVRVNRGVRRRLGMRPPPFVRFGTFRRVSPVSSLFGFDRGTCIDRYYIETFLARHSADIRGRVLEVADRIYTDRFGAEAVTESDVLHLEEGHDATIVGDLSTGHGIPRNSFDTIILTQTLQFVYDFHGAIGVLHDALAPGGVLLLTAPGISQLSRYD